MEGKLNLDCCLSALCLATEPVQPIQDIAALVPNIWQIPKGEPGRSTQPKSKYVSSASWPEEGTFPGVQLQSTWVVGIVLWAVVSVCHRAIKINSLSSEVRGSNPRLMFTRATISLSISRWVWRYQRNLSGALWLFIFGLRRPVQLVLAFGMVPRSSDMTQCGH